MSSSPACRIFASIIFVASVIPESSHANVPPGSGKRCNSCCSRMCCCAVVIRLPVFLDSVPDAIADLLASVRRQYSNANCRATYSVTLGIAHQLVCPGPCPHGRHYPSALRNGNLPQRLPSVRTRTVHCQAHSPVVRRVRSRVVHLSRVLSNSAARRLSLCSRPDAFGPVARSDVDSYRGPGCVAL